MLCPKQKKKNKSSMLASSKGRPSLSSLSLCWIIDVPQSAFAWEFSSLLSHPLPWRRRPSDGYTKFSDGYTTFSANCLIAILSRSLTAKWWIHPKMMRSKQILLLLARDTMFLQASVEMMSENRSSAILSRHSTANYRYIQRPRDREKPSNRPWAFIGH